MGTLAYLQPALASRTLPLIETARAVALYSMARTDAGAAFLEAQYAYSFTATYQGSSQQWSRHFDRLSAVPDDAVVGRIAAGAHFRNSCVVGVEMGRKIARHALANFLRPVPRLAGRALNTGEFQRDGCPHRGGKVSPWRAARTHTLVSRRPFT